jgi:anti-sigma factor (TIGR02949 family)
MNCRDCARALNPYLDRELTDDDLETVREHLEACAGCFDLYTFEESLRRLVRVRCQEQAAPDSLRERISPKLAIERTRFERRST